MKNFLIIFLMLFGIGSFAQTQLPAQCEAFLPKILAKNLLQENEVYHVNITNNYGQNEKSTRRYWVAYSDRENNITYKGPRASSGVFDKLYFNEEVRIAKIEGEFALVYEERKNGTWPEISEMAKTKGWVPMKNLLLWQSCPANEKGIYYKALIVANIDHGASKEMGRLYKSPESTEHSSKLKSSMEFFFVMKKDQERNLVLLSKEYTLAGTINKQLVGWVSANSFVPWNQRSCLEPNWNPDDVSYFQSNNRSANVFADTRLSVKSAHFDYGKPNSHDKNRMTKFRMPNEALRYPILDNDSGDDNVYKCTTFGFLGGSLSNAMLRESNKEAEKKKYLSKLENVNLTIVIDGTSSMDKYFPTMKEAIKQAFAYLNKDYKVRVGIVIYRDYSDGDYCVEYMPLQDKADIVRVNHFLDNGGDGKYGIKSSPDDHTHEEALYKGIETALDNKKMGFNEGQSNLMLVVGDCGNDESDKKCLSHGEIVSKLVKNNVQLMVFQVRRNTSKPWLLFTQQMNSIMMDNMRAQYAKINAKVKFKEIPDGYELKTNSKKEIFVATNRYADLNTDMPQEKLRQLIIQSISNFDKAIRSQIEIIDGFGFAANTESTDNESSVDSAFVVSRMGLEYYQMLKTSNTMMAFKGYTKKIDPSGKGYWKPVIFISGDELDQLIKRLTPVYVVSRNGGNDRLPYVQAMKALVKSMVPDITDAEMDQKGTGEIINLISGLNESTASLRGPSLVEIQDPKAVTHQQFQSICADFSRKFRNIQRIKQQKYQYMVKTNNKTYYWIPIEDMP